jgi:hypothetical protein
MTELAPDLWQARSEPSGPPVPLRYRGVWQRTLLQTSHSVDDSSWVHWMQLGRWHADLRVPRAARPGLAVPRSWPYGGQLQVLLQLQQGFAGITQVHSGVDGEICTWHRLVDYQPPEALPDAGHMSFDGTERVIETGVHGAYREVWQRLEGSTGRYIALAEPRRTDGQPEARVFLAGRYLMRVRPAAPAWQPGFEISFGELRADGWHIVRSTRPELEGRRLDFELQRAGLDLAHLALDDAPRYWRIVEWED